MNKIYKVIWSKTRNCYVAVAEFVKRSGKGSSLNRRHIAAALAAVAICAAPAGALAANSGGHWDGDDYIGDAPYNVTINEEVKGVAYGRYETDADVDASGATLSIVAGGKADAALGGRAVDGVVTGNKVEMTGGEIVGLNPITIGNINVSGMLIGGFADTGNVEKNTVELAGGTVNAWAVGGFSSKGEAKDNSVTVSGGEVKGSVYGGHSANGNAANNTVIISGGTVNGGVYGGQSIFGNTINNTVILSKEVGKAAPDLKGPLYGGIGGLYSSHTNNTLQVEAVGLSAPQIARFDNYKFVLPSDIKAGDTMLTLTNQNDADVPFDSSRVSFATGSSFGLNLGESITLLHKTGGSKTLILTGNGSSYERLDGEADGLPVKEFKLNVSQENDKVDAKYSARFLYGDGGTNTKGQRETGNTLTITGGKANAAFGGRATTNDVTGNKVEMTGGELVRLSDKSSPNYAVSGSLYGGYSDSGAVTDNSVDYSGGTVNRYLIGGYSKNGAAGKEGAGNRVVIRGGVVESLAAGGYSVKGDVADNSLILSDGSVHSVVYGGRSDYANATGNAVNINGGTAGAIVYGGHSANGNATDNEVTVSDGTIAGMIRGGYSERGMAAGNTVTVEGGTVGGSVYAGRSSEGKVEGNTLNLYGGTVQDAVSGGYSSSGGTVEGNTLNITGGKAMAAFGGRAATGDVTGNKVDMSGGELVQLADSTDPDYSISGNLYGGYADAGNVQGNTVKMSGGKVDSIVVGGFSKAGAAGGDKPEDGNKVIMTGGEAREVMGGYTYDGDAGHNTVSVSNAKVAHATGGATLQGDAVGNTVTLTNTELSYKVTGGDVYRGRAAENTVTIDGGSVGMNVYGGVSISGNVENNTVSILGGKINGVLDGLKTGLTGGYGSERVVGNTVAITGGELFVESVYGGYHTSRSGSGLAEKNVVTLGGGTYDAGLNVIGGGSNNEANDNAVNLTGTTQGLEGAKLYGWKETEDGATVTGTGNELHIGGAKTYDKNGTATITKGSWQGMDANGKHTNRVDTVSNFDSIALHHVVWGDTPALAAKEITNIGGLDVTGLEFFTRPDNSTVHEHAYKDYMVLVHADTNDLTGLKISYRDEGKVKTEALTNQGIYYHDTIHHSTENGVTVDGIEKKRIYLADHNKSVDFCFHVTGDKLTVGEVEFVKGGTARILDGRFDVRNAAIDTEGLTFSAASKLQMAAGDAMTLVDAEDAVANKNGATLQPFATKQLTDAYSFTPAEGVTVAATLRGTLNATPKNNGLVYKVNSNQADRLTFGSVDWKDSGALFKRPAAVTFAGANVDTSEIHFKNLKELQGNAQMTLVSDFGGSPGRITGTTYKIGTTLEGEGAASLVNGDLIFTTKAGTKNHAQEQTHNTVMGMTAGLAALAGGTEQISQAMDILSLMDGFGGTTGSGSTGSTGNAGDNTTNGSGSSDSRENSGGGGAGQEENEREANGSIIASVGGGHMHQETGSHVTSNTWNGVLGIGGKRVVKNGTWQYAAFAEHGRANFTLHSDTGRGDGTSKYTGGGLLAKWQSRHDVYVEGSIRAGRMHDTASDMLYDAATGQSYGYDVHANYIGGHVGLGKVFRYNNGRSLDVYGKYFHMKRDGVSFEAEGHYDLDSVTSSVLRVGARYGATDKKWNWYGGLAYEYEFDGKSTGRADGAEIRAASIKGGSVRGELGIRMEATKTSPWKADIRLTGYAGKRRGIGGNVSVAYTF